jgi:hypothetical protein
MKAIYYVPIFVLLSAQHPTTNLDSTDSFHTEVADPNIIHAPCAIRLRTPASNSELSQSLLDNGKVQTMWQFSWFPCQEATRYHLYVIHIGAQNPIINNDAVNTTTFTEKSIHYGITELEGWTWKVRALVHGQWTDWSEIRQFSVMPVPCMISGKISGPLEGEYHSDTGEHYKIKMEKVFLTTPDGSKVQEARIINRQYVFRNVPSGKSYRVYTDSRFKANPEFLEISEARSKENYKKNNFIITGVKSDG